MRSSFIISVFLCATVGVLIAIIGGCSAGVQDQTYQFKLPPELQDYRVINMQSENGVSLFVLIRRTNETRQVIGTTYAQKVPTHTIIIDGDEYVRKSDTPVQPPQNER